MPRPKSARPAYRYHVSGQAIVTLGGREFYLGRFNSPKSNVRYLELLRIYQENGLSIPDPVPTHQQETDVTVGHLLTGWRKHGKDRNDFTRFRTRCNIIEIEYSDC